MANFLGQQLANSFSPLAARTKNFSQEIMKDEEDEGEKQRNLATQKRGSKKEEPEDNEDPLEREISNAIADLKKKESKLTASQQFTLGKDRYAKGLKNYQFATDTLQGNSKVRDNIKILSNLNKSKKLPKNLGRINVDGDGNLRLPFLASSEAQRYVKTLNEFSSAAKGTFGARVTNFDLSQFMKRYPTLLNSEKARDQLVKQMDIANDLNSVYYKNLKKVYEKAGGIRNLDIDVADRLAEKMSKPEVDRLSQKSATIGDFETIPDAVEFKGKTIKNPKTGERLKSDGQSWVPVGG